MQKDWCDWL